MYTLIAFWMKNGYFHIQIIDIVENSKTSFSLLHFFDFVDLDYTILSLPWDYYTLTNILRGGGGGKAPMPPALNTPKLCDNFIIFYFYALSYPNDAPYFLILRCGGKCPLSPPPPCGRPHGHGYSWTQPNSLIVL